MRGIHFNYIYIIYNIYIINIYIINIYIIINCIIYNNLFTGREKCIFTPTFREVGKLGSWEVFSNYTIYATDFQLLSDNPFSLAIGRHRAFKPAGIIHYQLYIIRPQPAGIIHYQLSIVRRAFQAARSALGNGRVALQLARRHQRSPIWLGRAAGLNSEDSEFSEYSEYSE